MASTDVASPDPHFENRLPLPFGNVERTWPRGADSEFQMRVEFVRHHTQQTTEACAAAVKYSDPGLLTACSASVQATVPQESPLKPSSPHWIAAVQAAQNARHGSGRANSGFATWRRERLAAAASAPFVAG